MTTPVNWKKGDDVIVHPSVSTEEAKTLFPEHTVHKVRLCSLRVSRAHVKADAPFSAAVPAHDAAQGRVNGAGAASVCTSREDRVGICETARMYNTEIAAAMHTLGTCGLCVLDVPCSGVWAGVRWCLLRRCALGDAFRAQGLDAAVRVGLSHAGQGAMSPSQALALRRARGHGRLRLRWNGAM